jgi:hypothetical protein
MIECRHCRDVFRQPVEKIGARCPTCRMPLFERDRSRPPVVDLGPCAVHPDNSAAAKCQRCGQMMCALCRTRWDDDIICAACLNLSLRQGDANPRQARLQKRQASLSLVLAVLGWGFLFLTLWPLSSLLKGTPSQGLGTWALILFFGSFWLALFALGQAGACIRVRGSRMALATCGLSLAGLQIGLGLGLMILNIWHR